MIVNLLSNPFPFDSLSIKTANNSFPPHLSFAASGAVIEFEKSPITEPYASEPSALSNACQFTIGESIIPYSLTSLTLPWPGPPLIECAGIVPLCVDVLPYWAQGWLNWSHG